MSLDLGPLEEQLKGLLNKIYQKQKEAIAMNDSFTGAFDLMRWQLLWHADTLWLACRIISAIYGSLTSWGTTDTNKQQVKTCSRTC